MGSINGLSEEQILALITAELPAGDLTELGPGDDCAIVQAPGGRFVVTTDVLVEDRHFKRCWSGGFQIGARAIAQNLADVAAMGATPSSVVVSLVMPTDTEAEWVREFARGLSAGLDGTGAGVVGGDLSTGDQIVVSVTAHGVLSGAAVTRTGAEPGDIIALAGTLGKSAAGMEALTRGKAAESDIAVYLVPQPPLAAGPLAAEAGARALMDVSDGLVKDSTRMARASKVTIDLHESDLDRYLTSTVTMKHVLFGGEDHSLLAAFPAAAALPEAFLPIGVAVTAAEDPVLLDGRPLTGGWDHFQNRVL